MNASDLVVVRTFVSRPEADVAKSALDAAGIESMVRGDDAGGVQPGLWRASPVQLIVRAEDEKAAHDTLERGRE